MGQSFSFLGLQDTYKDRYYYKLSKIVQKGQPEFSDQKTNIDIMIEPAVTQIICTPDSLITALAKIGGLLGLSKILGMLGLFNEWKFERKLKNRFTRRGINRKREEESNDGGDSQNKGSDMQDKLIEEENENSEHSSDENEEDELYFKQLFSFDTFAELKLTQSEVLSKI